MKRLFCLLLLLAGFLFVPSTYTVSAANEAGNPLSKIVAAIPRSFPPQYLIDETGQPAGFAIDVMDAVAKQAGIQVSYDIKDTWRSTEEALAGGDAHVIPNLGISNKREKFANFTSPLETFHISFFVEKDSSQFQRPDDVAGHIVGAVDANLGARLLAARTDIETRIFPSFTEALIALLSGRVKAIAYPQAVAWQLARENNLENRIRVLEPPLQRVKRAIAVRKDLPELLRRLQVATDKFMDTPAYVTIYSKWHGKPRPSWNSTHLLLGVAGLMGLVGVGFAGSRLFSRKRAQAKIAAADDFSAIEEGKARFKTLTSKLLSIYVPLVTVAAIVLFLMLEVLFYQKERDQLVASLNSVVTIQSAAFQTAVWEYDVDQVRRLLGEFLLLPHFQSAAVFDASGEEMGRVGDIKTEPEIPEFRVDKPLLYSSGGVEEQIGRIVMTFHSREIWRSVFDHLKVNAIILLVLVASLVASTMFAVHIVIGRPLGHLRRAIEHAKKESVRAPVPWESSDELGQVVRAYNEMQEKEDAAEKEVKKYQENLEKRVRERTAELRDARDEAQAATLAKATFLATMSHEIRTPMNGVVGMIDLLRETKLNEDQLEMVGTVRESAYSLLTIINDILDFSKVEAGKLELEEVPISVRDIVEGVSETLAPNARNKSIGFSAYIDPEIPDVLIGDQTRLRQILFNLAGNAVKFTEKGKVLVRADRVPSPSEKTATVRFRIIDTGIGIPEEAQQNLFRAFSQVDASTTRRFGGTGLGLSICVRLSELMGGKIGVESEPGKGSTFEVVVKLPTGEDGIFPSDGHDLKGVRVLNAIRDDDVRELFSGYLEHWGAEVASSADFDELETVAQEAVSHNSPFDVVVLGSGWEPERQTELVKTFQGAQEIAGTGFVVMRLDRRKGEREALDNTVYVDSGPVRRGSFIKGVAAAAGRASPEIEYSDEGPVETKVKAPTAEEAEARGELILLAEDNLTNQNVIRRQINMLGYAVEIADDGVMALELLRSRSFAVLLTDCHMPNMDGFELTRALRTEQEEGQPRFPIVAITASVMKEEVDNCFAAGMDDFLPKPLEMARLKEMLAKWMPKASQVQETSEVADMAADPEPSIDETPTNAGPIDPRALKDVFGDDDETFREILVDFVDPSRAIVGDMEKALGERTAADIGAAAHKLKSSSRSVGAHELADLCEALEMAGKSENWEMIYEIAPQVGPAMEKVADYIENL